MTKPAARRDNTGEPPLRLKVTLRDIKPPIWRRLVMPAEMTLGDLHQAIQAAMGWEDSHLHAFAIAGQDYGDPDIVDDVADEERVTLKALRNSGVRRFTYTYDFGDSWEHTVLIERPRRTPEAGPYPVCTAGERHCPPEDCGGPWGYQDLLAVLADPRTQSIRSGSSGSAKNSIRTHLWLKPQMRGWPHGSGGHKPANR